MRRFLSIALTLLLVISLSGCFLLEPSKPKKLTTYYSGSAVVSVRYYHLTDEGDYRFEELAEDKIDDFVEDIDNVLMCSPNNFLTASASPTSPKGVDVP